MSAEVVTEMPAELNDLLVAGELDVSVISAVEYARHAKHLALLPISRSSCDGPVRSVVLFSEASHLELEDEPVLLTASSRTSIALLELLAPRCGASARASPRRAPRASTSRPCSACRTRRCS